MSGTSVDGGVGDGEGDGDAVGGGVVPPSPGPVSGVWLGVGVGVGLVIAGGREPLPHTLFRALPKFGTLGGLRIRCAATASR